LEDGLEGRRGIGWRRGRRTCAGDDGEDSAPAADEAGQQDAGNKTRQWAATKPQPAED
jgi:hypothetical protein